MAARVNGGSYGYDHIEVRPKREFVTFRTQDVGEPGGIQRVAGKRQSGSWDDQKWLISKELAHLEVDRLIADTREAKDVLNHLGSGVEPRCEGAYFPPARVHDPGKG